MASAGSVTVDFDARSARFASELEKVRGSLKQLEANTSGLATAFRAIPALFAAKAVADVVAYGKAMWDAANAIDDMAQRSGLAVESVTRLKFIAEQSGVEFNSLATGIKTFQKGLSEASIGSSTATRAFAQVRIEVDNIRNLPLEEQLRAIAAGFERVRNPADQTRIAMDLFGKAGAELVPFLNQGPAGLKKLAEEADRLGITLDGATVGAIAATDDAMKKLKATVDSFIQRDLGRLALFFVGIDNLPEIVQVRYRLEELKNEAVAFQNALNPQGKSRFAEISSEITTLTERLRILEALDSYKTISGRGGLGRPGGGGNPNSRPGIGGQFVPFKAGEGDQGPSGLRLDDFLSPESRQQLLDELNVISRVSREMDYQDFLDTEYFKRRAQEDTFKKQVEGMMWAQQQEQQMRLTTANLALGLLNTLAGKSKAAAIAAVLLNRGLAISQAVQNTAVAVTKALTVDPTGALAARVATLGKIQIGIIAATGALEVANIAGGNPGGIGGTTLGTPANPIPTTGAADAEGATARKNVTVVFNGPVTERDALLGIIKDAFDADVVVIPAGSRQAQEIRGG